MHSSQIENIHAREILDSRGTPTVQAEVILQNGVTGIASVPSGASTGIHEALELRDNDKKRYHGKGVLKAVGNINNIIDKYLKGKDSLNQAGIDRIMLDIDGTPNKSSLGANAILAVSLANAKAAALFNNKPFFRYIGNEESNTLPVPMMNIINGGKHASNNLDIQEFMILPLGAKNFADALRMGSEVFHTLKELLLQKGSATSVGDEGGFAPDLSEDEEAIKLILKAIEASGYIPGKEIKIALDAASSEWFRDDGSYFFPKKQTSLTKNELIGYWKMLISAYPIASIEDGIAEDDWDGWKLLTTAISSHVQLVGDDLFVTDYARLQKGIDLGIANSILIKLNQIGTLSETINTIKTAHDNGYKTIISHRSGETEDTSISDLCVAVNAGQIKSGAPSRSERVAKYNRLLVIEEMLGKDAVYPGISLYKQ
ncbi:MAG: phosphopyruvate hydratase [Oscillospiraceae bacterium]|nr:phosphopyruvate hydratase [Oscillospiraceae bacterium]